MKIKTQAETVVTVERERERATLYSTWNSSTRPHTSNSLENRKIINMIKSKKKDSDKT